MKFKDYEYGWYGFNGAFAGQWFQWKGCHTREIFRKDGSYQLLNEYESNCVNIFKQLPKLKNVIFIYGDYKETI